MLRHGVAGRVTLAWIEFDVRDVEEGVGIHGHVDLGRRSDDDARSNRLDCDAVIQSERFGCPANPLRHRRAESRERSAAR